MKSNKKKAFTLTELLVVVIVIGVLSAAVLPKFSKVIETRKTTEAEELMASVRTEQEKRCALDKQYLTQMSEMTDIVKNNDTKNFTITLAERGIDAESKGKYNYTLKMPSYADGRICCDGTECNKLNKNYPTCEELKGKPDYQESPADCAGVISEPEEPSGPCDIDPYGCECNPNQAKCCADNEVWQDGKCAPKPKECTGTKPATSQECNKCGTQTRTVTCDTTTGEWVEGEWGQCSKEEGDECDDQLCKDMKLIDLYTLCEARGLGTITRYSKKSTASVSKGECCAKCEDRGFAYAGGGSCKKYNWELKTVGTTGAVWKGTSSKAVILPYDHEVLKQYDKLINGSNTPAIVCDFTNNETVSIVPETEAQNACKQCSPRYETCNVGPFYTKASSFRVHSLTTPDRQAEAACALLRAKENGHTTTGDLMLNSELTSLGVTFYGDGCWDGDYRTSNATTGGKEGTDYSQENFNLNESELRSICPDPHNYKRKEEPVCSTINFPTAFGANTNDGLSFSSGEGACSFSTPDSSTKGTSLGTLQLWECSISRTETVDLTERP